MNPHLLNSGYSEFFSEIKDRIQTARVQAGRAVNRELVLLYWDIGRGVVNRQKTLGWGKAVVDRLARDLREGFPDMRGFSTSNVWRMLQLYTDHTSDAFLSQVVREMGPQEPGLAGRHSLSPSRKLDAGQRELFENLSQMVRELVADVPWGHHANVLAKLTDPAARLYYLRATAHCGWSRNVLANQIKSQTYERAVKEKKTHNFERALPGHLAEQADEMLKSRYNLEFLGIAKPMKERELEDRLISRLQQFILELGYGFCFVGRQYRLALGRKEYFVDLLFYHRFLKALVAFDLKIGSFIPEHAGKMDFYLNLLNEKERAPDDHPSIGIVLCAEKDDVEVEFALKSKTNPIGVAEYELQEKLPAEFHGRLPSAKQLADMVREIIPLMESHPSKVRSKRKGEQST